MGESHRVLVVSTETFVGLAAVRSLGRRGVEVYGAQRTATGLGGFSRYCRGVLRLPKESDPSAIVDAIQAYVCEHGITHIMGATEDLIGIMNEGRAALACHAQLLFPDKRVFQRALYKDRTLALAVGLGIEVPPTRHPRSLSDLAACANLRFPVILKPRHRDITLGRQRLYELKSERADDYRELVRKMQEYAGGELPLVQQFVPGRGLGLSLLLRRGEAVCAAQHLRLHEDPPAGGVSVYCRTTELDARLLDQSVRLLRAMEWEGVAMIEYRYDEASGRTWLMEVNGRFWGSLPLAVQAGADFPYLLYRSSLERVKPCVARPNVYARIVSGDTKWLWATLRERRGSRVSAVLAYLRAFRPRMKYFIWAADDPMPAVRRFLHRFLARRGRVGMGAAKASSHAG